MSAFRWIRCECCSTGSDLTVHHCWPKAESGHGGAEVTLCRRCHDEVHRLWGPGDRYRGPREAKPTIVGLRRHMALLAEARQAEELANRCRNLAEKLEETNRRHRSARASMRAHIKAERIERLRVEADRDDLLDRLVELEPVAEVES